MGRVGGFFFLTFGLEERPYAMALRGRRGSPSTKVLGYFQLPLRGSHALRAVVYSSFVPEGHPIVSRLR